MASKTCKMIEMALKLQFLPQIYKNALALIKILVVLLVAFTVAHRFFKRLYGLDMKQAKKRCRPHTTLFFSDINTKLLK